MDYDSLKTDRDDVVRDGADFEAYRRPGALIDSDHPKITDLCKPGGGRGQRPGKGAAPVLRRARRPALRPLQHADEARGLSRQHDAGGRAWILREQGGADGGAVPRRRHPGPRRLRRRAQSHDHQAAFRPDGQRHLLLSRLHRGLARRALGQGHARLQQGADRALRPQAARMGRRQRFDLSPVRSRRPAPHGVSRLSRRLRRHPVRRDPRRVSSLLSPHDARAGGDAVGGGLGGDFGAEGAAEAAKK